MTTRSVPAGSAVSPCQSIAGARPETSFNVRAMSRSRLMPGKTTTAEFMGTIWREQPASSTHHLDAVVLDHGIGQQPVGGVFERRLGARFVGAVELDIEHLALAHAGDTLDA